jgi:hypothetical protein
MLSKAEKYGHESLFWFKKKLWLDPTTLPEDPVEARLETLQIHADIVSGTTVALLRLGIPPQLFAHNALASYRQVPLPT